LDNIYNFEEEIQKYGLTIEQYEESLKLIEDKKINKTIDIDWSDIVQKYNLSLNKDSLRKSNDSPWGGAFVHAYLKNKENKEISVDIEVAKSKYHNETAINKDGSQSSSRLIEMSEEQSKDINYVLKAHGFDNKSWDLISAKNNIWNVYSKVDGISTLYSSKITVKPIALDITSKLVEEWFNKLDRQYSVPNIKVNTDYLTGDKLLLIDISDLHLNLHSSMFTTGNEYNCDIAEELFFYVIDDVLSRTNTYQFNKIIFTIGGDLINADNIAGTTTRGTPQSNELHLFDAYERLCAMIVKAIDILKEKAPVDVVYVAGNHDLTVGFKLSKYIDAWFRNEEKVNVDYSPLPRKYVVFGKTLFVFAHNGNVKTLPRTIADEARQYWSDIETTEVFLQHLHSEQVLLEDSNMRIQRLPTISAKSEWAVGKGYNSKRQCKSFIFDKENGMTDILYTPIKVK
jgi:UDP-2,3-diacylglucosamine pyrophosphatase LpxH